MRDRTKAAIRWITGCSQSAEYESQLALHATVQRYEETVDPKYGCTSTCNGMRWSYGDWSFFPDVCGDHFDAINAIVQANFDSPDDVFEAQLITSRL